MNRNFALFHLAMARPSEGSPSRRSVGGFLVVLVVGAVLVAAIAIPFISG